MSPAAELIERARALGVDVALWGGAIQVSPPGALPEDLRAELRALRQEVQAELEREKGVKTPLQQLAAALFNQGLIDEPVDFEKLPPVEADDQALWADSQCCQACGGRRRWRLRRLSTGRPGEWICSSCHPPGPGAEAVEWRGWEAPNA